MRGDGGNGEGHVGLGVSWVRIHVWRLVSRRRGWRTSMERTKEALLPGPQHWLGEDKKTFLCQMKIEDAPVRRSTSVNKACMDIFCIHKRHY